VDCFETRGSLWGMRRELERSGVGNREVNPDVDGVVMADAAWHLGVGMANMAKVLGPEKVVVGFVEVS
jgi:predicted NBD/HSP70 family sugar kinase